MKNKLLLITILLFQFIYSQNTVKFNTEYGSKNKEINDLMDFQNIGVETLQFESSALIDKYYEINIKEYKKGKHINTKQLFDGASSEYFKIDSTIVSFKFFTEMSENKMKVFIKGNRFGSKRETFHLEEENGRYVLKDFQGSKKFLNVSLKDEFPILAIITATKHKDGSGSYCEVAQSEIDPEKFGEKFNIPHYYVISMRFK